MKKEPYKWPTDMQEILMNKISKKDEEKIFELADKIKKCDESWKGRFGLKHNEKNIKSWKVNEAKKERYWKQIEKILDKYRRDM